VKTRIKKNDIVEVLSGKEKGRRGRVLAVLRDKDKALVERLNLCRKHRRRTMKRQGGIETVEAPLPLCKLMLVSEDRATRVRIETDETGQRRRVAARTGKPL
jgi:large subunit ribosomal protein L24